MNSGACMGHRPRPCTDTKLMKYMYAPTINLCTCFDFRVKALAGVSHPSVWKLIELIKKEDVHSRTLLTLHARGEPPRKRVRQETRRYNARLVNLVVQFRNGQRNLEDFLRAIGHNIRFGVERQQE